MTDDIIEIRIINAVRKLLEGRVNEINAERNEQIPIIEFGNYTDNKTVVPDIVLDLCEKTEKERIIKLDVYSVNIKFYFNDERKSDLYCYHFSRAIEKAVNENKTLGGIADRVEFKEKKYVEPKHPKNGEGWSVILNLRITVEEMAV